MVAFDNDDPTSTDELNDSQEIDLTDQGVAHPLEEEIDGSEMLESQEEFEEPRLDDVDDSNNHISAINPSVPAVLSKDSSHQEFYYHVEKRNFFSAFKTVFDKVVNLDITTIIEDEDDPIFQGKWQHLEGLSGQRIITRISLLDGDIKNIIGSRFIEHPAYKDLLDFHMKQVDKGQDIIDKNLNSLQKALNYLRELRNQEP